MGDESGKPTQDEMKAFVGKGVLDILVDKFHLNDSMVLGIGSGSTIVHFIHALKGISFKGICIPTSYQSEYLLRDLELTVGSVSDHPSIDITVDGADEISPALDLIKGGGGCHVREKVIAYISKVFIVIADDSKYSAYLGEKYPKIPLEILPFAVTPAMDKLTELGYQPQIRMAKNKAGPVISDQGNVIVDCLGVKVHPPVDVLHNALMNVPGVIDTGIFFHQYVTGAVLSSCHPTTHQLSLTTHWNPSS